MGLYKFNWQNIKIVICLAIFVMCLLPNLSKALENLSDAERNIFDEEEPGRYYTYSPTYHDYDVSSLPALKVRNCAATETGVRCEYYTDSPTFYDYNPPSYDDYDFFSPPSYDLYDNFDLIKCPDGTWKFEQCTTETPPPVPDVCTPEAILLAQQMRAALRDTATELIELGGLIYRRADGTIGASPWVRGDHTSVEIFTAHIPDGATAIAGWHTHPTGTWDPDPDTGAYTQAGQFFSDSDLTIANPEWIGTAPGGGLLYSGSRQGFLGLGLGLNTARRSGLYFLRDDALDTGNYTWDPATIMDHADDITNCGLEED